MGDLEFEDVFPMVATWQGHVSYQLFSIYAVYPHIFSNFIGSDPGAFLFCNMLYGQGVQIYTRPAMKRIKPGFRLVYSIYGSYIFNFSSLIIFFAVGEACSDYPFVASILSYFLSKCMHSMFYSYLYFVDKCADETRTDSILDLMFHD